MTMTYATTATGIRGLLPYRSTFNARARGDTREALSSQRVFRFKTQGESSLVWQRLIEAAREDLGCAAVWTVPGHDPNATSRLQELFGVTIRRARTVPPRKYGHHAPVDLGSFDFPPPPASAGRVLLVDDVCTSGGTLAAIREHLAGLGVEAVPLALGVNPRLLPRGFDTAPLLAQWESFAAVKRAAASEGRDMDLFTRIHAGACAWATVPLTRPMTGGTLNAVMCALWDLPETGFPWRCDSKAERFALGRLAASGLVTVSGMTNDVRVKLPVPAILGAWAACGGDPADVGDFNRRVAILAASEAATATPWGMRVVMGFRFVPSAGEWWKTASASDTAWRTYTEELAEYHGRFIPLLLAGAVRLYVAHGQAFWALASVADGPDLDAAEPAGVEIDADLWQRSFETAACAFVANPPDAGNAIARMLPASRWL